MAVALEKILISFANDDYKNNQWVMQLASLLGVCLIAMGTLMAFVNTAYATTVPASVVREQDQIIGQQEQFRRQQLRDLNRSAAPKTSTKDYLQKAKKKKLKPICFNIDRIRLEGVSLLSVAEQQRLTYPYLGRCLTLADINEVVRTVTNAYIDLGFVTTRAYLAEQNLKSGLLVVDVFEGSIEQLNLPKKPATQLAWQNVFRNKQGKPLNIFDLEQNLDQINRLAAYNAKLKIVPGDAAGESIVDVDIKHSRPVHASVSFDNWGLPNTGQRLATGTFSADNVFGLYDYWSFLFKQDLEGKQRERMSQAFAAETSIPFGYWLFRGIASEFEYVMTTVQPITETRLRTLGKMRAYTAELDRVIHRNGRGKTTLAGGLTLKENLTFTNNSLQSDQSRKLTIATLRLGNIHRLASGVISSALSYNKGLPWFGALHDAQVQVNTPRAQFESWQLDVEYFQGVIPFFHHAQFDIRGHAQWAPHRLYPTEELSIGGRYTVRGFQEDSIIGSRGAYLRSELSWQLSGIDWQRLNLPFKQMSAFTGLDAGWIYKNKRDTQERGTVRGMTVGLRSKGNNAFGELELEHALHAPAFVDYSDFVVRFKIGAQI